MLFGGGLFGGQLFIGNLYGGADATEPPPVLPPTTGGGSAFHPRLFWSPLLRTRSEVYQTMVQRDEEEVMLAVLAAFIKEQD